ncbi:class I SAM-dependent methyltransferase [Kitasatospora sp. CB01950]|uniref:class I SAM-dependent methyltransferase n=1 Tax=Kitasatospora sp. CB01950 TaxID=1703930 RepID=UPI00093E1C5B|nr:class I SAM-dependent methyltransferase [Kitasatospora sp. CB01950]OKJ03257.1 6-O-methylguanine DNA methyltransferase [Kitasatospora sp. CB01950]
MGDSLARAQREHWERTYSAHPGMYGDRPSESAECAATVFPPGGVVLELGAGHGRDALFFARRGFAVIAADFSPVGLDQLGARAAADGLAVTTLVQDVRRPLRLPDGSVDAVYAHMLFCMALTAAELEALVGEVRRVLRPGGVLVYTVRHTGDAHYRAGTGQGDDIWEHGGFAVHFFSRDLVDHLAEGWGPAEVEPFEEGDLPRRLWRVTQRRTG